MNFSSKGLVNICFTGFLTWLIPLIISIPFYQSDGTIIGGEHLFKSVMIVVGCITGALLLIWLFSKQKDQYFMFGVIVGIIWLFINWILDLLILIPMSGDSITEYMASVGLRYLMLPCMTIMAGKIADNTC